MSRRGRRKGGTILDTQRASSAEDTVDQELDRTATVLERGRADNEAWAAFRINHPHGLHGRPSAHVFKALRRAGGDLDALLDLECGGRTWGGRATEVTPTTFWRLKARRGDRVQVRAQGPDARKVVALVMQELAASTGTHEEAFTPEVDAALLEEFGSWEAVQAWAFYGGPWKAAIQEGSVMQTSVDAELDRLVSKRASQDRRPDPDEQEEGWKASVRAHNRRRREENRQAWAAFHEGQAASLRQTLEGLIAEHEAKAMKLGNLKGKRHDRDVRTAQR